MRPTLLLLLAAIAAAQVPYERIRDAAREPGSWLTYSGSYNGWRHSPLTQLTPANVSQMRVKWAYQMEDGADETTPLVADNVLYLTGPHIVEALDARTGRTLWTWRRPIPKDLRTIGFPRVNRGVALLGSSVYVGTLDGYLVALDAQSGAQRWATEVGSNKTGHSITVAPLAVKDKIIVGVSGGEAGIRGFLDAYDAKTGKRAWRFWTIPGPGEKGNETWGGESWKTGAGPTWVTGSYDPELNLVYWGVGNPGPDWNGDARPGHNLYTCSVVALDAETGTLKWHFQFTPHDTHDWDANQIPVLVNAAIQGKPRKLLVTANRNGFYYVLDRATGQFIRGTAYAKQTWAKGLDDSGRPVVIPGLEPSEKGTIVYPSLQGSTNWYSPSYSPITKMFYVAVREMGAVYFKGEAEFKEGSPFTGGGEKALRDEAYGAVRALDVLTGKKVWEFKLNSPAWAGLLSTAGGLVFGGSDEGNLYALDAATGKPVWDFQSGGRIRASPISFLMDGKQVVAVSANRVLYVFGL